MPEPDSNSGPCDFNNSTKNFEISVLGNAISCVLRDGGGQVNTLTNYLFLRQFY